MEAPCNGRGTRSFPGKGSGKKAAKVEIGGSAVVTRPMRPWREQLRADPLSFYTIQASEVYGVRKAQEDVGKTVKASKRVFSWEFCFGPRGVGHVVELRVSVLSGKRTVTLDGSVIHSLTTSKTAFAHSFSMEGAHLVRVGVEFS